MHYCLLRICRLIYNKIDIFPSNRNSSNISKADIVAPALATMSRFSLKSQIWLLQINMIF